jgi:hypothetical protein
MPPVVHAKESMGSPFAIHRSRFAVDGLLVAAPATHGETLEEV